MNRPVRHWVARLKSDPAIPITVLTFAVTIVLGLLILGHLFPQPLSTHYPPAWASWLDIFVTFPLLAILCCLSFRGSRGIPALLSLVLVIPIVQIFASYFVYYAATPLGLAALKIPWPSRVSAYEFGPILAIALVSGLLLGRGLFRDLPELRPKVSRGVLILAAISSVLLAYWQYTLRYLSGARLATLVSDVGITTNAGGRDLLHGINPYTHPLPPWGGHGSIIYGPVAFGLASPFSALPATMASQVAVAFFVAMMCVGIWKAVRLFNPQLALPGALLFLALPTTSWMLEASMEIHAITGAVVVWTLYAFLARRDALVGLLVGIGALTSIVPGLLIFPLALAEKSWKYRLTVLLSFLVLLGGTVLLALRFSPSLVRGVPEFLHRQLSTSGTLVLNSYLPGSVNLVLKPACLAILVGWSLYAASRAKSRLDVLRVAAVVLVLVPFAIGFYYTFFFLWGSAAVVMYLMATIRLPSSSEPTDSIPPGASISFEPAAVPPKIARSDPSSPEPGPMT
ncbi:MAG: glycosyltransferase 87 family protein [Thermoplasmata archaeon]